MRLRCHEIWMPQNFNAVKLWCNERHCWLLNRHWQAAEEIFPKSFGKSRNLFAISRWIRQPGVSQSLKELLEFPVFSFHDGNATGWEPDSDHNCSLQPGRLRPHCPLLPGTFLLFFASCFFASCFFASGFFALFLLAAFLLFFARCFFCQVLFLLLCHVITCFAFVPSMYSTFLWVFLNRCFYAGGHHWCGGPWGLG